MKKMSGLERISLRLVVLAAVLFVVVYFMLDKRYGNPPELEDASKYTIFLEPRERGIERTSLAPGSIDPAEIGEFK